MATLAQLRKEAADLNLATYGSIPQLEARIAQHRAKSANGGPEPSGGDDPLALLGGGESPPPNESSADAASDAAGPETPGPGPAVQTAPARAAAAPATASVFTNRYVVHAAPDDATHQQLCQQVRIDAHTEGHQTRGHGYRVETVYEGTDRYEVYAIALRRART